MKRNETTIEKLRYRFTPEEHLKNAEHLAGKLHESGELKQNTDAIKADLAEQKKRLEAEIGRYARLVSDGFDMRDVQCRWDYGRPSGTQKTLVRLDTNEDVRMEMMLDHERQEVIKFESPSHVLSGPGSLRDRKVSDLDQSDIDYFASRDVDDLLRFGWIQVDIDAIFAEAKRRSEEASSAARGPQLVPDPPASPSTAEVASESSAAAVEEAECARCGGPIPLSSNGRSHVDGSACAPLEPAHTLPSARAVDGTKPGRRRTIPIKPPTAEEREALEQLQAEEAAAIETDDPRDEAPEA